MEFKGNDLRTTKEGEAVHAAIKELARMYGIGMIHASGLVAQWYGHKADFDKLEEVRPSGQVSE